MRRVIPATAWCSVYNPIRLPRYGKGSAAQALTGVQFNDVETNGPRVGCSSPRVGT